MALGWYKRYIVQHRLQQQELDKDNRKAVNVCQSVCRPAAVTVRTRSCEPSSRQRYRRQPDARSVVSRKWHLSARHRRRCPLTAISSIDTPAHMRSIPSASTPSNGPASKTHQHAPWWQHPLNGAAAQQRQRRGCAGNGRRRVGRSPASPPPTAADAAAAAKHRRRRDEDLPWHDEQRTTTSTAAAHPTTAAAPRDDGCVRPGPPTALAGDATPDTRRATGPARRYK